MILDEISFDNNGADRIENLLLDNPEQLETGRQMIKSLAILLLKYLQAGDESSDIDHLKFKNADNSGCKLNGFKLLTKWIL